MRARASTCSSARRSSAFFFDNLGACRRRTPGARVNLKVPKNASHRDLFDATLRFDLAPRRSPSACPEKLLKIDPHAEQALELEHAGDTPLLHDRHDRIVEEVHLKIYVLTFLERADGERRGPASIWRVPLKARPRRYRSRCPPSDFGRLAALYWLYLGVADGVSIARVWACRYPE